MFRTAVLACLLSTLAVLSNVQGNEVFSGSSLKDLTDSLNEVRDGAVTRRNLQQSWTQFNNYYAGNPTAPYPGNLPTYYGQQPGPCKQQNLRKDVTNKCTARACKMAPSIKAIIICADPIPRSVVPCRRIDEWITTTDCNNYPGQIWLWNTDAGNIRIGGIYLDLTTSPTAYEQTLPPGKTFGNSSYPSETTYNTQFNLQLTLSEAQFDLDTRVDINKLRITARLCVIFCGNIDFTLTRDDVGVTLRRSSQTISSSNHGISFRLAMIWKSNQRCDLAALGANTQNTTCFYRSDRVPAAAFYRANPFRIESFKEGIVYEVDLTRTPSPSGGGEIWADSACLFDFVNQYSSVSPTTASKTTNLGLSLDIGKLCPLFGYDVCRIILNAVLNLFIGNIVKGIICQLAAGLFFLTDNDGLILPSQIGSTANKGVINKGLLNIYNFLKSYVGKPLSSPQTASTYEDVTAPSIFNNAGYTWPAAGCATTSYCPYPLAIDFNSSDIFKSVSLGLNNILGNVSTTPEYYAQNKLTIVEVIDILTGNKDGVLKVGQCPPAGIDPPTCTLDYCAGTCDGDIKAELKLSDYPRFTWDNQPLFDGALQLNGFMLSGLNSITALRILDNGFDSAQDETAYYTHTLRNNLTMTKFGIELNLTLTLRDGSWVHRPRNTAVAANQKRSIAMQTNVYFELSNILLNADIMLLLRPDLLAPKKIGGVFGNFAPGSMTDRLRCAAFGLDLFQFSKLQVSGVLSALRFQNFVGDLGTVITKGTQIFNKGYVQATGLYLSFIADNFVRPQLNDYLFNNTFDKDCGTKVNGVCPRPFSEDVCNSSYPYYFTNSDPNRYINFYDSKVWNVVKGVVNNLVGGIPVRTGAASINTIIDKYLDWYIPVAALRNVTLLKPANSPTSKGNVDIISNPVRIQADLDGDGLPDPNKFIEFSKFGVENLETIHELSIKPTSAAQPRQFRLDFKIGGGKIYDRLANSYIVNGPLVLKFHLNMTVIQVTNGTDTIYTADEADFRFQFINITVGTDIYALLNQNEYLDLKFSNLADLACILALVDGFDMFTLSIGFQGFGLNLARSGPGGSWRTRDKYCNNVWNTPAPGCTNVNCLVAANYQTPCSVKASAGGRKVATRMSDALDRVAWEALTWGPTVNNMVKYIFNGVAKSTQSAINAFAQRQIPVANCDTYSVLTGSPLGFVGTLLGNASDASDGFLDFYRELAVNQYNPRFPKAVQNNPSNTMFGSRSTGNLAIKYNQPDRNLTYAGFPARCIDESGAVVSTKGPYNGKSFPAFRNISCWEDDIDIGGEGANPVDIRNSFVVTEIQNFISKSGQKVVVDALNALSTTQGNFLGDSLISYVNGTSLPDGRGLCNSGQASYCIDLDANLTALNISAFKNDMFIPGLTIDIRRLKVNNIHTFDATPENFELLKPYIPDQYNTINPDTDSRFTLAHRIRFTGSSFLTFQLTLDVSVAQEFLNLSAPNPSKPITDTMVLDFQLQNLDIQMMTTTAINATRVTEVPFYYVLTPFSIENCFFSIFYANGLSLPQFQVYVSDIVGPFATITAKSPAGPKPNIFSAGVSDLITASLEIIFQLIKQDLPDATQGKGREYINRVLKDYVDVSRAANNCPPPPPCGDSSSWCHYVNFMESTFQPILSTLNTAVGGNPVKTSQVDINSLIELGLNYSFMSPTGPRLLASQNVQHPEVGDWILPVPLSFTSGLSYVRITNVGIRGLDSIYKLVFNNYPTKPYSLSFALELGNGLMQNGSNQPATNFTAPHLMIQAEVELVIIAKRPGNVNERLANNSFRVELSFSGLNVSSLQQILVNKTDLYLLNINQISKSQCVLAIVDKVTLETVSLQIADFDVNIPDNNCGLNTCTAPGTFGRNPPNCFANSAKCNIGIAIDTLRGEAITSSAVAPPSQSTPLRMINTILHNLGTSAASGFNQIDVWNKTRENCDVPRQIFTILSGVSNSTHANQLASRLMNNVTGVLTFPPPQISADYTSVTVQSNRLNNEVDAALFINEVIKSAQNARGLKPNPEIVLVEGSICDQLNLPTFAQPLCGSLVGGSSNFSAKLTEWTTQQPNLIEDGVSPLLIEDRVRLDINKDSFYDIRASQIVKAVSNYFDDKAPNVNQLLRDIANTTDILRVENDSSVSLVVNMTDAIFWIDRNLLSGKTCDGDDRDPAFLLQDILGSSSTFIPSFSILPGLLTIKNFGAFSELMVIRPYKVGDVGARFTTRSEFGWRKPNTPLNISLSIDLLFDTNFINDGPIPSGIIDRETINITLSAQDLLVQVLTLLAVDTKELGQVRLGDFLNVDDKQEFKRNCKAATCLMKGIFDGGLYLPQLTINVTNVVGPRFTTTNKLFSHGMEQLIDALFELVVQLFRDDLAALTQGPLRDFINGKLISTLANAKAEGSCPPRRNYTQDYPLGRYFCSHNDTVGVNPLLTQNENSCKSRGNGRICKWSPPDGPIDEQTVACIYTQESKILNFKTARGLVQLKDFVNGSLMNPESALYVNNYLGAFASSFKTKLYKADGLPLQYNGKDYGKVTLGIGALELSFLNTLDRLQIFDPAPFATNGPDRFTNPPEYEPSPPQRRLLLNAYDDSDALALTVASRRDLALKQNFAYADNRYMSRTAFGWSKLNFKFEVLFSFDQLFVPRPDGPKDFVENHISVEFKLQDFDFAIDLYMLINIPRLMDLQIRSIGTIYELPCILEIFEDNGLVPARANITYGEVGFDIQCVNRCDSPLFAPLRGIGFSDAASSTLKTSFTSMFKRVTDFLINLLASSDAQTFLDRQISISNKQCVAIKAGDLINIPNVSTQKKTDAASAMGIAGLASIFAALVGFALLVPVHFRRRDELMKRALLDAHSRGTAGKSKDEFELAERRLKSAFEHPMMPKVVKFGVPIGLLVNIIFFATANFAAPGAIVELTLSIAGDTTFPITLLPFTLPSSINDMWNAGTYPLAIIIALASGGWPYAKQIMLLFCWFAPATVLHPQARGRFMEILDALGKWSLIDIYVLVMLMVGFRFFISSSYVNSFSLLPPDVLVVDVVVAPGWGIFGFVFGAMGSLVINHIMTWHHRKVIRMDEDLQDAILGTLVKDLRTPRIPLSRHRFNILDAEGRPYRYSVTVRVLLVFSFALAFLLLIIGACLPVIQFKFRGIAGLAISFIDQDLGLVTHSVVSIGTSLIQGARDTTESVLGILFIQILYILFALVLPLVLCILLVCIWLVPLTLREQLLLYFAAEILSCWEAVLVLVISLIATILQISELAQFIVNAATGSICKAIEGQLQAIFPDPEDAKCFNVIASLLPSSSVFVFAAVIFFAACTVAFRLIHVAIEDRELAMRRKPPHSPGEMTGLTGFLIRRSLEAFGASQIQAGGSVANLYAQGQGAFDYRDSQLAPANPILTREMPQSMSGMQAPNPMFHGSMQSARTHQSIDV